MPIFQDGNGLAIKFFVQKDIAQEIQAELCETITSLGGRVEAKVPRSGYILVQPGTAEEERLRLCWASSDRPDRHFVPYTYVEACKIAGMLLKQIFVHNGEPMKMHIHHSIANVNARVALEQRIMHSGGDPTASAQSARVILADPNTEVFQHLVKLYQGIPDKYIESYLWVKKCVEKGSVAFTPFVYKNPGGRRPGEERTQFTEEDEEHLCNWIAAKIPYKETGGRTGNRLYQQLCDLAGDPEYAWVTRHTWQSWRERYKKNAARLDNMIATTVDEKKPVPGEKGQYGYVRRPEEKVKRPRKKRTRNAELEAPGPEYDEDYIGNRLDPNGEAIVSMIQPMTLPPRGGTIIPFQLQHMPAIGTDPIDPANVRKSPAEEEMEDTEESPEWQVRIGNDSPPAWAKRKSDEEGSDEGTSKKTKTDDLALESPSKPTYEATNDIQRNLQVIIHSIAKEFRFTGEEVQEFYDKCVDVDRTRKRFQRMREELSTRFSDDTT